MRYVFYSRIPTSYSGGRYHVLQSAISLARLGHEVEFVAENLPPFYQDFTNDPLESFTFVVDPRFSRAGKGHVDWVIYVPDFSTNPLLAIRALETSIATGAQLALIDFETPLWFNAVSGQVRPLSLYHITQGLSSVASLVISLTRLGSQYAKDFFHEAPRSCRFDFAMPAINVAALENTELNRERFRILALTRFTNGAHKGFNLLPEALSPSLKGLTLTVIHDGGRLAGRAMEKVRSACQQYGLAVEEYSGISDQRKFDLYSESIVTVFPSNFEGFGMPVIESLAAGAPCIVRELPVYTETVGGQAVYFDGTAIGLRRQLTKVIAGYDKESISKGPFFDFRPFSQEALGRSLERQMGDSTEDLFEGFEGKALKLLGRMRRDLLVTNIWYALKHPKRAISRLLRS